VGLVSGLVDAPRLYGDDPYFAVAREGGEVVAATMRTPPHNLILSEVDDEGAIEGLAADAHAVFERLPGVIGPKLSVAELARVWEERAGQAGRLALCQRAYSADTVVVPEGVPGSPRPYEERDRDRVAHWLDAFVDEALPDPPPEDSAEMIERRARDPDSGWLIWEDGEPVSFGGFGGLTPNGIRVGPIYTPPELRRRGYASALTAAITKLNFDRGRRFCFLFTDLANPTSNSIYQRIGYRPVTDIDLWSFS
jgi:predicted GNAT family acetyltransferase